MDGVLEVKQRGPRSCQVMDGVLEVTRGQTGWMKVVHGSDTGRLGHSTERRGHIRSERGHVKSDKGKRCHLRLDKD